MREVRALAHVTAEAARAFDERAHCTVSWLTDTSTMTLIEDRLAGAAQADEAVLYSTVLRQAGCFKDTLRCVGPLEAERSLKATTFSERLRQACGAQKGVIEGPRVGMAPVMY